MFDALVNGRIDCGELTFEVAYYDIEELNRRAEAGETDVSKISYALLPEIHGLTRRPRILMVLEMISISRERLHRILCSAVWNSG